MFPPGTGLDYDALAEDYASNRKTHPGVLRELFLGGELKRESRVLEVGCGTGNYIKSVRDAFRCPCWAIDSSGGMLEKAIQRNNGVVFLPGNARSLGFADGFFDLVFSTDVIHHLGDIESYFLGVRRVLKKSGKVCTVTDSEWIIRNREPLSVYFPETVEVELGRYPGIGRIKEAMKTAGFGGLAEKTVEHEYALTDSAAYEKKTFSSLHLIPNEAFLRGIRKMKNDLNKGAIKCVSRYGLLWGKRSKS
jgi:ubiquinone/menaquinone biosynthesis C-methylase UbiE